VIERDQFLQLQPLTTTQIYTDLHRYLLAILAELLI